MNTFEFEITIQSELSPGAGRWPIVVRCRQPDGLNTHVQETLELGESDRNQLTAFQENEKQYGILLGKALFKGDVQKTLMRALSMSDGDRRLRILLSIEVAENDSIKTLHWERLCAPLDSDSEWQLLARNQRVPFSMYIPTIIDRRFPTIGRRDLRALIIVASPSNIGKFQLAPFNVKAAISGIVESLGDIPYDILANDITGAIGPPTLIELSKQLTNTKKPYTLLHIISHGMLLKDGDTALYWAQADNQVSIVTAENLIGELKNIGNAQKSLPHFAFLCTCESADPRAEGALGGLAQRLVRNLGMPAVVAMTRKVSIETGLTLGRNFYRRLRESGEVDTALQEATAGLGARHDVTVPALFSRLGGRPLFTDNLNERELSDLEIEEAIEKLEQLLQERAPNASILQKNVETQVKTLKNTRGSELASAREERHDALVELNNLCQQVLEISFDALALGKEPPFYIAECPFPGLSSFADAQYHKFFFGRDELIKDLKKQLEKDNFLAVLGPSGSGKSSVVLAGLIPQLEKEDVRLKKAYIMKPGSAPLPKLEKFLKDIDRYLLLVIDQFEEIFTLCEKEEERKEFIATLLNLAEQRKVIITIRADFLGECTFYPELRKRIEAQQKLVGPMEPSELVSAMTMQANEGGLAFESGLSHEIFDDVQGEPGAMPLLQYALQELWQRRRGRWLCAEEYQAIGRVEQAIAKTADRFYEDLSVAEREQFQNIFLRLTRLDAKATDGERRRDTRQRVELEDLVPTGKTAAETKKLVQKLAGEGARLVVTSINSVTGKEEVEVTHEALIRNWPTLQTWLNENRSDLQLRNEIHDAAEQWKANEGKRDRDDYLISQEGRLAIAEKLLLSSTLALNQDEKDYIEASVALREHRRLKEKRLLKRKLLLATIGTIVSTGFAILAGYEARQAEIHQTDALIGSADASFTANRALNAKMASLQAAKAFKDAKLLAIWKDEDLEERVTGILSRTAYAGQLVNRFQSQQKVIQNLVFSRDGKMLASSGGSGDPALPSSIVLWDTSGEILQEVPAPLQINSIAFSPDSKFLAVAGSNSSSQQKPALIIGDIDDKTIIKAEFDSDNSKPRCDLDQFNSVAFGSNNQNLVTAGDKGMVCLWRQTKDQQNNESVIKLNQVFKGLPGNVDSALLSPNGQFVAARSVKYGFCLWSINGTKIYCRRRDNSKTSNKGIGIHSFAFSPDNKYLVAATGDKNIVVLNLASKRPTEHEVHQGRVNSVAFSPDSKYLVTGGQDNQGILMETAEIDKPNLENNEPQALVKDNQLGGNNTIEGNNTPVKDKFEGARLGADDNKTQHKGDVYQVGFLEGGNLFTAGNDERIRVWDTKGKLLRTLRMPSIQKQIAASPDGKFLATAGEDEKIRLWDSTGKQYTVFKGTGWLSSWLSKDGKLILTVGEKDVHRLWKSSGQLLATLGEFQPVESGRESEGEGEQYKEWGMFSDDSQLILTFRQGDSLNLWNSAGTLLTLLEDTRNAKVRYNLRKAFGRFSRDSKLVLSWKDKGIAHLWESSGKPLAVLEGHEGVVWGDFSPDSQRVLTFGGNMTVLWDSSGKQLAVLEGKPNGEVLNPEYLLDSTSTPTPFSKDSKRILTFTKDSALLWDSSGKQLAILRGDRGETTGLFSPDGERIVTFGQRGNAHLWSNSGKLLAVLKGHQGKVHAQFSPDGKRVITLGGDGTAHLWSSSGQQLQILEGHKGEVKAAFSPDSKLILTYGTDDSATFLWDASGKLLSVLRGDRNTEYATFSGDGKLVITTDSEGTHRLWDTKGKQLDVSKQKNEAESSNQNSKGSYDLKGDLLAVARSDGSVAIWKTSGQELTVFDADTPQDYPYLSYDGELVLTYGEDGIDHVWRIKGMDELMAMNCNWLRDYLKNPNNGLPDKEREICDGISPSEDASQK
ncbi:CHAT domain-containing protein [Oscillatoria sp. FACHB-1406]|uniref:nSTAND1 domain-containing NTPase n=1 Tax=Oscillatoria sp. FACHB-1406 TaxID=2692846 RepID=UPI001687C081|nr:CHAT domain-containing protein [Oscillatoria sp. FACHB-1406]MBD2578390.1 CHAT domain-containing protein [Oscillatoria sp. FACHB-1406]